MSTMWGVMLALQRMLGESVWEKMSWSKPAPGGKERHAGHGPGHILYPSVSAAICHHLQGPKDRNAAG